MTTIASNVCALRFLLSVALVFILWKPTAEAVKPPAPDPAVFAANLAGRTSLQKQIDEALEKAAAYLVSKQSPEGPWRSETYGVLTDGITLTPVAMTTLYYLPQGGAEGREAYHRGVDYLRTLTEATGEGNGRKLKTEWLDFPVYAAATASWATVLHERTDETLAVQQAFLDFIRQRQFSRANGWSPDDPQFGGWGYSIHVPKKPESREAIARLHGNISATLFAIGALRNAGVPPDDPIWKDIRVFVDRCQNFMGPDNTDHDRFDGGFFFSTTDPARNKAGGPNLETEAEAVYYSYGSATADGLRALLRYGHPVDQRRVIAAERWLARNFSATDNPGRFHPQRETLRNSYYYYYCWSFCHAMNALQLRSIKTSEGDVDWTEAFATELIRRQRKDGSWANRLTDAKEDDPIIATSLAASALAVCRMASTLPETK